MGALWHAKAGKLISQGNPPGPGEESQDTGLAGKMYSPIFCFVFVTW